MVGININWGLKTKRNCKMNPEEMDEKQLLREILKWTKFAGMNQVKEILNTQLEADVDKLIYQNSDGARGTVELGKLVGLSKDTVSRMWQSWFIMGLGENIPVRGGSRFKRSFDLRDFGIKIPEKAGKPRPENTQSTT
jgi:hypothetical protein